MRRRGKHVGTPGWPVNRDARGAVALRAVPARRYLIVRGIVSHDGTPAAPWS